MNNLVLLVVLTIGGVALAAVVMAMCARLAGIEEITPRSSVLAAAGFGLPLAAAAGLLREPGRELAGLLVMLAAIVLGVAMIRVAFRSRLGQAIVTWVMNVCVWVVLSSLVIRLSG
ncbi:MAG: hypothetical protein GX100_05695 [candidate division WS1 bacterium]|nr:hypothetical protein [candidate division WS1 bacterium]